MAVDVKIKGRRKIKKQFSNIGAIIVKDTNREMLKIITEMDADVKKTISTGGRSGKVYGKRRHQASAPGEAPKTDKGGLVAGFLFDVRGTKKNIIGRIRNISQYAAAVEFKPKSKGGRPFMRPLYERWESKASKRLGVKIKRSIRKAVR